MRALNKIKISKIPDFEIYFVYKINSLAKCSEYKSNPKLNGSTIYSDSKF